MDNSPKFYLRAEEPLSIGFRKENDPLLLITSKKHEINEFPQFSYHPSEILDFIALVDSTAELEALVKVTLNGLQFFSNTTTTPQEVSSYIHSYLDEVENVQQEMQNTFFSSIASLVWKYHNIEQLQPYVKKVYEDLHQKHYSFIRSRLVFDKLSPVISRVSAVFLNQTYIK
ncbi:hypothetical protein J4228_01935 [Candidatus Woesearchaeota archaeon]|nr:hypothetical protein [Candidatus Woesearchaeota archaeon]